MMVEVIIWRTGLLKRKLKKRKSWIEFGEAEARVEE
jgi:hypothetical protein